LELIFGGVALALYVVPLLLSFSAVLVSGIRNLTVPLYWLAALTSAVLFPVVFSEALPRKSSSVYAGITLFLDGSVSYTNAACAVGAVVCLVLAVSRTDRIRVWSSLSWGLLSMFGVRVLKLVFL